jgi:hypothetical protein
MALLSNYLGRLDSKIGRPFGWLLVLRSIRAHFQTVTGISAPPTSSEREFCYLIQVLFSCRCFCKKRDAWHRRRWVPPFVIHHSVPLCLDSRIEVSNRWLVAASECGYEFWSAIQTPQAAAFSSSSIPTESSGQRYHLFPAGLRRRVHERTLSSSGAVWAGIHLVVPQLRAADQ